MVHEASIGVGGRKGAVVVVGCCSLLAYDVLLLDMTQELDLCRTFVRQHLESDANARLRVEVLCARFAAIVQEAGLECATPGPQTMRKALDAEGMGDLFCDRARRAHLRVRFTGTTSELDLCRAFVRRYVVEDLEARLPVEALCSRFDSLAHEAGLDWPVPGLRVMRRALEVERMGDLFCDRARRTHIRARFV